MHLRELEACLMVAACICAKDGVISEQEEMRLFEISRNRFGGLDTEIFEKILVGFFDSDEQIEGYLEQITDPDSQRFALELAEKSASEDGLDLRENIALDKAYLYWGIARNA